MSDGSHPDRVELRGLRLNAFCGVLPEEQARRQPIEIDLDVEVDLRPASASDDLTDTVDYGGLCDEVAQLVDEERFALLERLAARVADVVLAADGVEACDVRVRKLRPPVPHQLVSSGVRIRRTRPGGVTG
ncbi:MAG TPA: dihydroneopterin aldolase [Acidimicrobiales bacterium]|jgi:FolB domain-containing protein|nr:dihydroneopterin aldolase [Acidimicrobiales bacterium]